MRDMGRVARGREADGDGVGGGGEGRKSGCRCVAGGTDEGGAEGRAGVGERGSRLLDRGAVWKGRNQGGESVCQSSPTIVCGRGQKER